MLRFGVRRRQPFDQAYPALCTWGPSLAEAVIAGGAFQYRQIVDFEAVPENWPWEESVEIAADGETVVKGHVAVAHAIVNGALAENPVLTEHEMERWVERSRHADDDAEAWRKRYDAELSANLAVAWELEQSPERVMVRAGLSADQRQLMGLHLDGHGPREIARLVGLPESTVRLRLESALSVLRQLAITPDVDADQNDLSA